MLSDLGISDKETFQDNSNYLKSWIQVLKDDPNELFKASNEAEIISEFLNDNYEKEMILEKKKEENARKNEEGIQQIRKLQVNIKNWYRKEFPTDEVGETLNNNVSFLDLHNLLFLKKGQGVYGLLGGDADSIVRERCFQKLPELEGINYNVIYEKWLDTDEIQDTKQKDDEEMCV